MIYYRVAFFITMAGYLVLSLMAQGARAVAIGLSALLLNALVFWR